MQLTRREDGLWMIRFRPDKWLGPYVHVEEAVTAMVNELEFQVRRTRRLLENHIQAHSRVPAEPMEKPMVAERLGLKNGSAP